MDGTRFLRGIGGSAVIEVSASEAIFGSPYVDGLTLYTTSTGPDAIKLSGSDNSFGGLVAAPDGTVELSGATATLQCGLFANRLKSAGSDLDVAGCEVTSETFDTTTYDRTYHPDGTVDVLDLLWDRTMLILQVVSMTTNSVVTLHSKAPLCASCASVLQQFHSRHPNVIVYVLSG